MTDHLNKTVLIVDDDRVFLDSLEQFLLQRGYHSKVAWDADSALRIIRDFTLDVVVADVVMPGKDGIQLMHEAKSLVPDLDFIFMTGYSYEHSYVEIINAGAADYITKPFEMMELVARIERIEREKRLVQELRSTNARLKETVDQVNAMMEDVRQTAKAKSNLLADISHEIRTPLTGILGFTDILLATEMDPEQASYAKNIKMSGEVILSLINDFLDSAKVEAGKMQLEEIPFDPAEVCYDVCDLIRPRLYGKAVELLCRIGDQVPSRLIGDPHRFRQVLLNLMSNAAKFTKSGEIELSLETEGAGDASGAASVRVAVRDTGIGLAPDNMAAIFEPFRQSRNSVSREYGGTGLGLFLCKRISQMMDGDIRVTSRHGVGSTFTFLAVMRVAPEEEGGAGDLSLLSGKKALVAIPQQTRLEIVSHILETAGMRIVTADNAEIAGERLQQAAEAGDPACVCIVDACLTNGGEDGCGFIDQISRVPELVMPSVIALIEPMVDTTRKCEQAGCRSFLSKPVRRNALLERVKSLVAMESSDIPSETDEVPAAPIPAVDEASGGAILLAEDNPVNQKLVSAMLRKGGYRVDIVQDGRAAVDLYISDPDAFRLILMDVQMPGMDGISATRALREWENGNGVAASRHIPIIAVTAGAVDYEQSRYFDEGMDDLLLKPIRREPLFDMIEKWSRPAP